MKMAKRNTRLIAVFMVVVLAITAFSMSAVPVSAHTSSSSDVAKISWAKRLTPGQTNHTIAYWFSAGFVTTGKVNYRARVTTAIDKLMYPKNYSPYPNITNPIILWNTTVNSDSKMDFYLNTTSTTANASTTTWRKNTSGQYYAMPVSELNKYDWVYGEITLYHKMLNDRSNTLNEATIIHEMMHVYGAKDIYDDPLSIMHGYSGTRTVTTLTADANQLLRNKYS